MKIWSRLIRLISDMPAAEARRVAASRLGVVRIVALCCFCAIGLRVGWLAIDFSSEAKAFTPTIEQSVRGDILDRNGQVMATTVPVFELYADPQEILDPREAAAKLATVLTDMNEETIYKRITRDTRYAELAWRLSPKKYADVLRLGVAGIHGRRKLTRAYPNAMAAAHVLGGVNKDGQGIAGIEHHQNTLLASGTDLTLSIDLNIQAILREEISSQIDLFEAIGGAGIIQDIETGEIIAMVSLPDYDANHMGYIADDHRFNRATKGLYELGSTFKVMNTAMALESGVFAETDMIDVVSTLRVGRHIINDYHPEKTNLNVAEVLIVSSNKGSARIADKIGADIQKHYLKELGFFEKTALQLPELGAPLIPSRWGRAEIMTISYGHGISVTPVHLTSAIATTAGSGMLITPTLIKQSQPAEINVQVFSPQTTAKIRAMMRRVVSHPRGTANKADVNGYLVAGKTGTSEKISGNGYDKKANITSFVSVFPANDPKYVVFTMIDEPKGQKHSFNFATAGWVAAPVAGRIIQRVAPMIGVHPIDENMPEIRQSLMLNLPELEKEGAKHASF